MRIVENSDAVLRLRDRTLWLSFVFFGAALFVMVEFFFGHGDHRAAFPAGFFTLFGVVFLRSTDAVFDKKARVCRLQKLSIWRVKRRQFGFDDIADVRLDVGPTSGTSQVPTCRLELIVGSEVVPLTDAYEGGQKRQEAMRSEILDMLFKPRARPGEADPVRTLVEQGRLVDAVRILRMRDGLDLAEATARVAEMKTGP